MDSSPTLPPHFHTPPDDAPASAVSITYSAVFLRLDVHLPGAHHNSLEDIYERLTLVVYIVSLTTLSPVIAELPAKRVALVLVGDVDAAHHKIMKRDVGDLEKSA
ncbi:hypothetical protein K466DRAFT_605246 [Polyporus arcularius HHB13444]|uniref:Uncharacterized protein n=1 Tax=Polyporus arcularius HHB13444 TaxID=1314778 RepID=A0A5C3NTI0_9APHY|nr:hypothetical protein K466DRAFT_605246 [Polyporus arcularius HHB13444]